MIRCQFRRGIRLEDDRYYSVGIHPWNAGCYTKRDVDSLNRLARDHRVVAVGETGLDSVHVAYELVSHGTTREVVQALPDIERQLELLMLHIRLSEEVGKPLLLHVVKRYPEILKLRIDLKPRQTWIIHGFRGRPGLAKDLLKWGFYLSYGEMFNPLSVEATLSVCWLRRMSPRSRSRILSLPSLSLRLCLSLI